MFEAILINIIIPEIADILRRDPNATNEDIMAIVKDRIISKGRAFLVKTDPTP